MISSVSSSLSSHDCFNPHQQDKAPNPPWTTSPATFLCAAALATILKRGSETTTPAGAAVGKQLADSPHYCLVPSHDARRHTHPERGIPTRR